MDIGVKFNNFDSVKRCLAVNLDARYDLILGVTWLEHHEPWIDWKTKNLDTTRTLVSSETHLCI
ncbi:putative aspartic peptidase domain superfamily [Plasmopara halstedii]